MPRLLLAVGRPAGGAAAFGGRGPKAPACQTKAGAKGPGFVGALRPRRPPAGPQRFPQPWRKRGAAAAAASRKGTRQAQGLGVGIGCTAPPMPLRWTRGLGYPGRPGGGRRRWAAGGLRPPACQTKAGAKGPGFVGALRPRRPPAGPQRFPKKAGQRQTVPAGENLPFSR